MLLIAATGVAAGCGESSAPLNVTPVDARQIKNVIDSYRGQKAVLVNVWATWCVPCVEEFPHLVALRRKYSDTLQVIFVSADFPEKEFEVRSFLSKQGVDWETYLKNDRDETFISAISGKWTGALPATLVYDRLGREVGFWEGAVEPSTFEEYAQKAINHSIQGGQP